METVRSEQRIKQWSRTAVMTIRTRAVAVEMDTGDAKRRDINRI